MPENNEYAAVLDELRNKKERLHNQIAGIRAEMEKLETAIAAIDNIQGDKQTKQTALGFGSDPSKMYADMSFVEASRALLETVGQPMSTPEMVEELRKGGLRSQSKNPNNSLYASLLKGKHIYRAGQKWALMKWRPKGILGPPVGTSSEDVQS